jgi:acetyltransferase-like isoleucine patch superfamily enzyme
MRNEGKSSIAGRLLARIYAHAPWRLKGAMRRLIARLEGGEMVSLSMREVLRRHHRIEAGLHSYGCFDPSRFNEIIVGRYVSTGPGVRVFRRNHPTDRISLHPYFYNTGLGISHCETLPPRPLVIGDDAWIGANAIVLPGCGRIGRGAVVGAGSVVTRDVPDFAVVAGNPARIVRQRFPQALQDFVDGTHWWERSREELSASLALLQQPLTADLAGEFSRRIGQADVAN